MSALPRAPSLAVLSADIQSGKLDCRSLAEETFDRIRSFPDQSIFICLTESRGRREAAAAHERLRAGRSRGPLEGIPVAWKDLFDIEGLPTTAGSVVLSSSAPAARDAAVVQQVAHAGMVTVGRTNMSEFAFSGLGINPHYGTPRNPHSKSEDRLPGGSSSGSGVAVAAGLVPVSIGTDTSGSIRIPAAFNGIVGYKASRGRYSMEGVFPLAKSLDSLGPLCHTVQDAVWIDAAMRGVAAPAVAARPLSTAEFIVPETVVFDEAEPEVIARFEEAVGELAKQGARIRRKAFPIFTDLFKLMDELGALVTAEAYQLHEKRILGEDASRMDPRVVTRAMAGRNITDSSYKALQTIRQKMQSALAAELDSDAHLLTPTVAHVAPALTPLLEDDGAFFSVNSRTLRNTLIGNFFDFCGVSLPAGTGRNGLPVGLLISGRHNGDERLLELALGIERVLCSPGC